MTPTLPAGREAGRGPALSRARLVVALVAVLAAVVPGMAGQAPGGVAVAQDAPATAPPTAPPSAPPSPSPATPPGPATPTPSPAAPAPTDAPTPPGGATGGAGSVVTYAAQPPAGWPELPAGTARSVLAVDVDTGQVLAAKNPDERMEVASTVKLVTALTALRLLELDQQVTVGAEVEIGGSTAALEPGDTWTVRELLLGLLLRSGNDAAEALAVAGGNGDRDAFLAEMAATVAQLGIEGATITDPSGLDDTNLFSARDLATIGQAVLADPTLAEMVAQRDGSLPSTGPVPNRNLLLERLDNATGIKTGTTDLAGASLVGSATWQGREVITVVLGAINDQARYDETVTLMQWLDRELAVHEVAAGGRIRLPGRWIGEQATLPVWAPAPPDADTTVAVDGSSIVTEIGFGPTGRLAEYVVTTDAGNDTVGDPDAAAGPSMGAVAVDRLYEGMRMAHRLHLWSTSQG